MEQQRRTVEVFDTTLRDGLQVEGVSATVEDKLRIAEQLDTLGVHYIEGGWPGANPKDIEFFARAATSSTCRPRRSSPSVDPPAPRQGRRRRHPAQPGRGRHAGRVHRRQELGLPRDRGAADDARRGRGDDRRLRRVPRAARAGSCSSTWSTSSTATRPTPSSRCARSRPRSSTAPATSCCATPTAARCRTRSTTSSAPCTAHVGTRRHDRHPLPRRHRLRRRQLDGGRARRRRPRPGHAQRPRRAHGQRQPHRRSSPTSSSSSATAACPTAGSSASRRSATTSPSCSTGRSTRRRRTSARRRSPTRPASTPAPSPGPRTPTSTSTRSSVGNGTRFVVSEMAGRATITMKADELGLDDGRRRRQQRDRRPQAPRARGLPLRGGRRLARAADAPGRRMGARLLPRREHAGHHRRAAQRRLHHRGDGEGVGRRRAPRVHRRGQRPGQRHRQGAAPRAQRRLPRTSTGST